MLLLSLVYVALTFITNHLWKHQHHHDMINFLGLHKLAEYLTLDVVTEFTHQCLRSYCFYSTQLMR